MKAFKGCTNQSCGAYKKIHYKKKDQYCSKCGYTLDFVCADCWKPMESDENRLCTSCAAKKEQTRAQFVDKAKAMGGGAMAALGAAGAVALKAGNNAEKLANGAKKMADAGVKIVKMVKR